MFELSHKLNEILKKYDIYEIEDTEEIINFYNEVQELLNYWRVNMELDDEELKATQELHREKKEEE